MQMHVAHESPGTERGQPDDGRLIAESWRVPECFGVVFDRHAAAIHGYIARRLGRDAADDLVGETFLVAFARRSGYDPDQPSARPWLYGIATRLVSRHPLCGTSAGRRLRLPDRVVHALVEQDGTRGKQHDKDDRHYHQHEFEQDSPEDHGDNRERHYGRSDGLDILRSRLQCEHFCPHGCRTSGQLRPGLRAAAQARDDRCRQAGPKNGQVPLVTCGDLVVSIEPSRSSSAEWSLVAGPISHIGPAPSPHPERESRGGGSRRRPRETRPDEAATTGLAKIGMGDTFVDVHHIPPLIQARTVAIAGPMGQHRPSWL